MQNIPSPDNVGASWGFVEWAFTTIATFLAAIIGWVFWIGRKVGGYENTVMTLQADTEADREKAAALSDHYNDRLDKLRSDQHILETMISQIPDRIMVRIEPRLAELTRRIDESYRRREAE